MSSEPILLERTGYVTSIVLNRPDKLNAMTVAMDEQLNEIVHNLNNDTETRVIILTGAGGRSFSAGSDINDLAAYGSNWEYRNRFDARRDYARAIWLLRKPVIAAIDGYCIGGGLEMALASDVRLATPNSSFAASEIKWGWHGGSGATQLLTHAIGPGNAARLLLTGDRIDAATAEAYGLVQEITTDVRARADELAAHIASLSPIAVERTKHMIRIAQNVPLEAGLLVENDSFTYLMTTDDAHEGQAAFAEKRSPEYKSR